MGRGGYEVHINTRGDTRKLEKKKWSKLSGNTKKEIWDYDRNPYDKQR